MELGKYVGICENKKMRLNHNRCDRKCGSEEASAFDNKLILQMDFKFPIELHYSSFFLLPSFFPVPACNYLQVHCTHYNHLAHSILQSLIDLEKM